MLSDPVIALVWAAGVVAFQGMTMSRRISGTPPGIDRTKEFWTQPRGDDPGRHERFVTVGGTEERRRPS